MGGGEHLRIGIQQDKAKLSRKKKGEIEQFKSETQKEMQVNTEK